METAFLTGPGGPGTLEAKDEGPGGATFGVAGPFLGPGGPGGPGGPFLEGVLLEILIFFTIAGDDEVVTGDTFVVAGKFLVLELSADGKEDRLKLTLDWDLTSDILLILTDLLTFTRISSSTIMSGDAALLPGCLVEMFIDGVFGVILGPGTD